jgi:hypothetical protein
MLDEAALAERLGWGFITPGPVIRTEGLDRYSVDVDVRSIRRMPDEGDLNPPSAGSGSRLNRLGCGLDYLWRWLDWLYGLRRWLDGCSTEGYVYRKSARTYRNPLPELR